MVTQKQTKPHSQLSAKEISLVQEKMKAWLQEQNKSGDLESSWAGTVSIVGGGYVGVKSSDELASVIFG